MKIVNWNCGGAFRKKIKPIIKYRADIYIIQECEHPDIFLNTSELKNFRYYWKGSNKNKGLAIIYNPKYKVDLITLDQTFRNRELKWFLPVSVNDTFDLTAVWTHKAEAEAFHYIGQFYWLLEKNLSSLKKPIFIGDFNSNTKWDAWDRWWNHSDIVKILENGNIIRLYHNWMKEEQGSESVKTFYHRKNLDKGYHIDYIFADKDFIRTTENFEYGNIDEWLEFSDHIPLIWSLTIPQ